MSPLMTIRPGTTLTTFPRAAADEPAGPGSDPAPKDPPADPAPKDPPADPAPKDPPADPAPKDPPADPTPKDPPADPPDDAKPWFEKLQFSSAEARDALINNGFHKAESPEAALEKVVSAYTNAERKLGAKPDELIRLPKADSDPAEWRKANAAALGVPENPKGYEYKPPELPKGMKWDQDRADRFLADMHEAGVPKDIAHRALNRYVEDQSETFRQVSGEYQEAEAALAETLTKEWGGEVQARLGQAARAFHHFASEAGISEEARDDLQHRMMAGGKVTDAQVVKMFHAIAEAMGEDAMAGEVIGARGGAGVILTPSEAEARAGQIKGPEGEYAQAQRAGDRRRMKELNNELSRLAKIRAGGKG